MSEAGTPAAPSLSIGMIIRRRRRELGLSQNDLARQLGIAQSSISRLERGLEGAHHVSRILSALRTDADTADAGRPAHG